MPRAQRAVQARPGRRTRRQRRREVRHLDAVVGLQLPALRHLRLGDGVGVLLQVARARGRDDLRRVGGLRRSVHVHVHRLVDGVDVVGVGRHVAQADDVVVVRGLGQAVAVQLALGGVDGLVGARAWVAMGEEAVVAGLARLVGVLGGFLRVGRRGRHGRAGLHGGASWGRQRTLVI